MKETKERTLYECLHARVNDGHIRCRKGYRLIPKSEDGGIGVGRLAKGQPLAFLVCQDCPDFEGMGPPVPPEERGWLKKKEAR
jgi:hypothetical protein